MGNVMIYVWLGIVVVSLIIEFITFELVSVWIALGGLVGLVLALCGVNNLYIQIGVSVAVALLAILFLRKLTLKLLNKRDNKTNLDLIIGTRVKIIDPVTSDKLGSAKYSGIEWSVMGENGETFKEGTYAEVVRVKGNKLIVKKPKQTKVVEKENKTEKTEKKEKKIKEDVK